MTVNRASKLRSLSEVCRTTPGRLMAMNNYVGLDVSLKEASICIVDEAGRI
jgi:superfamily II DNA/RNA helicase